jgi:urease accessory protein
VISELLRFTHFIGANDPISSLIHPALTEKPLMRNTLIRRTMLATLGLASTAVLAHTGEMGIHVHGADAGHSFVQGALHPITGLDHLAAMLAVGLWSALSFRNAKQPSSLKSGRVWMPPVSFAATLLVGALLGLGGLALPGVEPMIAASLLVLGLLLATRSAMPTLAGSAMVAVFALFHGLAHGAELAGGHAAAALAGVVVSTAALHGLGMGLGFMLRDQATSGQSASLARRWLTRATGWAVTGLGLSLLSPSMLAAL